MKVKRRMLIEGFGIVVEIMDGKIGVMEEKKDKDMDGIIGNEKVEGDDEEEKNENDEKNVKEGESEGCFDVCGNYFI